MGVGISVLELARARQLVHDTLLSISVSVFHGVDTVKERRLLGSSIVADAMNI